MRPFSHGASQGVCMGKPQSTWQLHMTTRLALRLNPGDEIVGIADNIPVFVEDT